MKHSIKYLEQSLGVMLPWYDKALHKLGLIRLALYEQHHEDLESKRQRFEADLLTQMNSAGIDSKKFYNASTAITAYLSNPHDKCPFIGHPEWMHKPIEEIVLAEFERLKRTRS